MRKLKIKTVPCPGGPGCLPMASPRLPDSLSLHCGRHEANNFATNQRSLPSPRPDPGLFEYFQYFSFKINTKNISNLRV